MHARVRPEAPRARGLECMHRVWGPRCLPRVGGRSVAAQRAPCVGPTLTPRWAEPLTRRPLEEPPVASSPSSGLADRWKPHCTTDPQEVGRTTWATSAGVPPKTWPHLVSQSSGLDEHRRQRRRSAAPDRKFRHNNTKAAAGPESSTSELWRGPTRPTLGRRASVDISLPIDPLCHRPEVGSQRPGVAPIWRSQIHLLTLRDVPGRSRCLTCAVVSLYDSLLPDNGSARYFLCMLAGQCRH